MICAIVFAGVKVKSPGFNFMEEYSLREGACEEYCTVLTAILSLLTMCVSWEF